MRTIALACFALIALAPAFADTLVVRPDGSGDYPTIQTAIAAAADGDVIELTDGAFAGDGNRDLDFLGKAIEVRSASGDPASCVIDCGGLPSEPHRAFHFHSGEPAGSGVSGITITRGLAFAEPYGGGVLCEGVTSPTFRSCVFVENQDGGLVYLDGAAVTMIDCEFRRHAGYRCGGIYGRFASIEMTRCRLLENHCDLAGGGLYSYASHTIVSACEFIGNTAAWSGAAEFIAGDDYAATDCLFDGNSAERIGGLFVFISTAAIERCTFTGNTAAALGTGKSSHTRVVNCTFWGNPASAGSLSLSDGGTTMENTIIAGNPDGPSMYIEGPADFACCDIWGNAGGDWVGGIVGQYGVNGNISADPLFCDPASGDFTLNADSPCAPGETCDRMGAWPVGCRPSSIPEPPAEPSPSWGAVKALFR